MPPFVRNTCQYFSMLVNNCQYLTIQWRDFHNSASYATICSKYFSVLINTCPQRRDLHNSETYAQADRVHISISGNPVLVSCFGVSGLNWIKFRFLCWWKELYISHDRGISCNCFYIYASICKFVSLVLHICMCAFVFLSVSLSCFQVLSHYLRLAA